MFIAKCFVVLILVVAVAAIAAGRAGLLTGRPPTNLGVHDGRLAPPSTTPNSVSSQALLYPDRARRDANIEPLPVVGDGPATIARIRAIVVGLDGAAVVTSTPDYLYARFTSRLMRYVDDTEFWFDPGTDAIQVRSASRLGSKDFGVNRKRIETIRHRLGAP